MQVAVAASKLVLGKDVGDDRRSLADFIQKQSEKPDVPEDYVILFLDAVDILRSKRRI